MNEYQRNVAFAQQQEQQYRAWAAAQSGTPIDPIAVEAANATSAVRAAVEAAEVARIRSVEDPIERLLLAVSTQRLFHGCSGFVTSVGIFPPQQMMAIEERCPGAVREGGLSYDSKCVAQWFIERANAGCAADRHPASRCTFCVVLGKTRFRGRPITEPPATAWRFDNAAEISYRGTRGVADMFVLDDARVFTTGSQGFGPSVPVTLSAKALQQMAHFLGLSGPSGSQSCCKPV